MTDPSSSATFHAVLVSGRPSNWELCIEDIKRNVIDSLRTKTGIDRVLVFASVDASNEEGDRIDEMFEAYAVTAGHREDYFATHRFGKMGTYHHADCGAHYPSMTYHNKMSFSLLQDYLWQHPEERVGWVIYLRPDLKPENPVNFPTLHPERNTLYYLDDAKHYRHHKGPLWVPDPFESGDLESMRRYCSVFDYIHSTSPNMPPRIAEWRAHFGSDFTCPEREIGKFVLQRWHIEIHPMECRYEIPPRL